MTAVHKLLAVTVGICSLAFAQSASIAQTLPLGEEGPCSPGYHSACIDQNEEYTTCSTITLDIACFMVYGACANVTPIGCAEPSGECEEGRVWILCLVD